VDITLQTANTDPKRLTQNSRIAITQREPLVTRNIKGGQKVELPLQKWFEARSRWVCRVEQVIDLLTSWSELKD